MVRRVLESRLFNWLDGWDPLAARCITQDDVAFLRSVYLPRRTQLERMLKRRLVSWDYGEALLEERSAPALGSVASPRGSLAEGRDAVTSSGRPHV